MNATALDLKRTAVARGRGGIGRTLRDILNVSWRNRQVMMRNPETIVFGVVQPILLLMLFNYVFGGVIDIPGVTYIDYVTPAVMVQTAAFAGIGTAIALTMDLKAGLIDRFRSLPIARSAVLAGRTVADTIQVLVQVSIVVVVALLMGFRFDGGLPGAAGALGVAVLFGFAMTWIFATIGLAVRNEQAAQAASFSWLFPLVFLSSAYVPLDTLPGWLQPVARFNPVTVTTDTVRALAMGTSPGDSLWGALAWCAGIVVVFSFLAVRMYRKAT